MASADADGRAGRCLRAEAEHGEILEELRVLSGKEGSLCGDCCADKSRCVGRLSRQKEEI